MLRDESAMDHSLLSAPAIRLADYAAPNGFGGSPINVVTSKELYSIRWN
jgi:hypothetical protein